MTAISILHAIVASAANPLKTDTDPANASPAPESGFRGELDDAIQAWAKVETKDTTQSSASDDDAREPAGKNEDHPQLPLLVAVVAAILPSPPPAAFGLPAIGPEPGSNSDGAANQTEIAANVEFTAAVASAKPAPEASASLSINPPAPPEATPPDPKADLAFAMRLVSLTPDREVEPREVEPREVEPREAEPKAVALKEVAPKVEAARPTRLAPAPKMNPQLEPASVQSPAVAAETSSLGPTPPASPAPPRPPAPAVLTAPPEVSSRPVQDVQPDKITPAAQSPVPAIYRARRQDNTAADSEPHQFDGGASEKEQAEQSPKPATPRGFDNTTPEIELKPLRESGATPAPPSSAQREIPLPMPAPALPGPAMPGPAMPGPLQTAVVSPSAAQPPAPAAEHVAAAPAAVRNNPTSEVTDMSVTVPVPRADSAGEDRVAIRLVQKGAEIHVSVRTPDHQLTQTLRQDLGRLTTELDQAGFRTETWRPVVTGVAASSPSSASHESSQGAPNRDTPGWDARSGGREGRSAGEQKRRQPDERPRWVVELEQHKNQ